MHWMLPAGSKLIRATTPYIGVFGFRNGKIFEGREFHNPDVPAEAFTPHS